MKFSSKSRPDDIRGVMNTTQNRKLRPGQDTFSKTIQRDDVLLVSIRLGIKFKFNSYLCRCSFFCCRLCQFEILKLTNNMIELFPLICYLVKKSWVSVICKDLF